MHGQDLPDAESLFYHLKHSGSVVRLFYVGEEDVDAWVQMMEEVQTFWEQ